MLAPAMTSSAMSPAQQRGDPQFASLLQQQQQGYNIFGLTPIQLQQMLMMQTHISQLQGNANNNQVADQVCLWYSTKRQMHNDAFKTDYLNSIEQFSPQWNMLSQQGSPMPPPQQQQQQQPQLAHPNMFLGGQIFENPGMQSQQNSSLHFIQARTTSAGNNSNGQPFASFQDTQPSASTPSSQGGNGSGGATTSTSDDSRLTGRAPIVLYMSCDDESLSEYQCLVRKNIELFEANQVDVDSNAQGRNKPIVLGQVGIRCRHCTMLPPKNRSRGAMYYPAKLAGLYQAAQNQANGHLVQHCNRIPPNIRSELVRLKDCKSSAGGGKKYWADGVKVLGVYEDANGLRFEKRR